MKRPLEFIGVFIAIIGTIIALAALIVGLLNWLSPFSPVGTSPISNNRTPTIEPSVQSIIIVVTATSDKLTSIVSQSALTDPLGSCDPIPVNVQDDLVVLLNESSWYVIEDFDNSATPPVHKFLAKSGPANIIANPIQGQRAWHCSDEGTAIWSAALSATGYKQNHPDQKVYGPDGKEIQ